MKVMLHLNKDNARIVQEEFTITSCDKELMLTLECEYIKGNRVQFFCADWIVVEQLKTDNFVSITLAHYVPKFHRPTNN